MISKKTFLVLLLSLIMGKSSAQTDFRQWAQTPPMGWNSWDCYGPTVEEHEVKANTDYMAEHLRRYGWEYVVVDIRWFVENDKAGGYNQKDPRYVLDEYGRYMPAVNRFPSAIDGKGFKALADYVHSKRLKFGIHIMRGIPKVAVEKKLPIKGANGITADQIYTTELQCRWLRDNYTIVADRPGAQEYYNSIMELYASWGVDFIKIDDLSSPYHEAEIELIRKAIDKTGHPIVLSTSPGETPVEKAEHVKKHANMWRMVNDVWDKWSDLTHLMKVAEKWYPHIRPGTWPDCDMIPLGKLAIRGERGEERMSLLTPDEQYSLMTFFSILRSPLMFGGDLPSNDALTLSLLTNEEVLRMHRESTDVRQLYQEDGKLAITSRNLRTGCVYLAFFNLNDNQETVLSVPMADLDLHGECDVTNMWSGEVVGHFHNEFGEKLKPHACKLYKFTSSEPHDLSNYILTPPEKETPRINSAKIVGVRPGSDFLFTIATTGKRPMAFSAQNLPNGLKLNKETGIIMGKLNKPGEYTVLLKASNALGNDERKLRIVVGDEIALTPPMGWNSWNCWGNSVSQEKVLNSAKAMVEKGLINYGWTYINIDDGWQSVRGGKHTAIMPNTKFPDMKGLINEIHRMGMKVGIYSAPWVGTYAGHLGSHADNADGTVESVKAGKHNEYYRLVEPENRKNWYHTKYSFVKNDAKQWEEWGIDYLKYDWDPNDVYNAKEMHDALRNLKRDVVFSISNSAPYADAPQWARYTNSWRTTGDIIDTWESVKKIGFNQERWLSFSKPGHWIDPDMLVVGKVGWGPQLHETRLTPDEQYTHISLWALLAAPLLIGGDIAQMDDFTISLLCNSEVIDVNQDPLGHSAAPVHEEGDCVVFAKPLEDGSMALGFFNKGEKEQSVSINLNRIGLRGKRNVRDLWRQMDMGEFTEFTTGVPAHGVKLVKVSGNNWERILGRNKRP